MLKVGDKVKIKKDIKGLYGYVPEMEKFAGMELTVIDVQIGFLGRPQYILSGTIKYANPWKWCTEHFE